MDFISIHKAEFQVTCDLLIKLTFSEDFYELHEPQGVKRI